MRIYSNNANSSSSSSGNFMYLTRSVFLCLALLLCGLNIQAANERFNSSDAGLMLHGYDTVAYFEGNPRKGIPAYSARYKGERYLFSSAENRSEFLWNPEKYAPSFGGYCAYGVRMGKKFDIDPEAYEIVDGKLFVLLNRSTQALWKEDLALNIGIAHKTWPAIVDVSPEQL